MTRQIFIMGATENFLHFAARPDIIFADEPTGNLDSKSGSEVMKMLCTIREKWKKTLVVITHDPRIAEMADRHFTMIDGELSEVNGK